MFKHFGVSLARTGWASDETGVRVDWFSLKSQPNSADSRDGNVSRDGSKATGAGGDAAWPCAMDAAKPSRAHKPSERFTRGPLAAKSRASQSERFKIASLKEKLNHLTGTTTTNEENKVFNGYRPGQPGRQGTTD